MYASNSLHIVSTMLLVTNQSGGVYPFAITGRAWSLQQRTGCIIAKYCNACYHRYYGIT